MIDTSKIELFWDEEGSGRLAQGWTVLRSGARKDGDRLHSWYHMYPPEPTLAERLREVTDSPAWTPEMVIRLLDEAADALDRAAKIEEKAWAFRKEWARQDSELADVVPFTTALFYALNAKP